MHLLDLKAIKPLQKSSEEVAIDNVTAKFYPNKQEGMGSLQLCREAMLVTLGSRMWGAADSFSNSQSRQQLEWEHKYKSRVVHIKPLSVPSF